VITIPVLSNALLQLFDFAEPLMAVQVVCEMLEVLMSVVDVLGCVISCVHGSQGNGGRSEEERGVHI
jgi:hypothetical protein